MKSTRRTRKGGSSMFVAAPPQEPQTYSQMIGVQEYRNPVAMQQAQALMGNPLFNINKIQSTGQLPVNKGKIKDFAQSFLGKIVQAGPNGKPRFVIPSENGMRRNTAAFSTAMGFAPQAAQPPAKNLFGNPVSGNNPFGPNPGVNPWQVEVGPTRGAWHIGLTRGGLKSRRKQRKSRRRN
jgi:hypothetical protein